MCVLDEDSGRLALSDAVSLRANMARKHVLEALETLTGTPCATDDPQRASMLSSGAFSFCGAEAACVCSFSQGRLRTIEIFFTGGTAEKQREALFTFIKRRDPCLENPHNVRMRRPYGTVWITIDARSGDASLRIAYAAKE
ncbi:MAG: hypothetical protein JW811_07005 [Clostridiales bacterium]|nr:hypothetical protein [Clostridiales bacterium]